MAASFPTSAKSFAEKRNSIDIYDASHMNDVQNEIMAMQTAMGIEGQGSSPSLSARSRRTVTAVVSRDKTGDYYCDGVADDVQIQAAIDAVEAAGGGTVLLRSGTYVMSAKVTVDGGVVHIEGEGIGATIIQKANATSTLSGIITLNYPRCSLRNLTVDGNKANQTTSNDIGVVLDDTFLNNNDYITVENVEVKNINKNSSNGWGFYLGDTAFSIIKGCLSHDNEDEGFYIDAGNANYNKLIGCNSYSNTGCGFLTHTSSNSFIGCFSIGNSNQGFYIGASRNTLSGCHSISNAKDGINLDAGDNNIVTGCLVSSYDSNIGVGVDADNTYSGILLSGTTLRNVVTGNRILQITSDTAKNFQYGIREAAVADNYNNISANSVTDAQTAQVSVQGANTVVDGTNIVT